MTEAFLASSLRFETYDRRVGFIFTLRRSFLEGCFDTTTKSFRYALAKIVALLEQWSLKLLTFFPLRDFLMNSPCIFNRSVATTYTYNCNCFQRSTC